MTLTIKDLKPALAHALGTIKKVRDIPTIGCSRIRYQDGELTFTSTDRYILIEETVPYEAEGEFEFVLSEESLTIINKLPLDYILEFSKEGVKSDSVQFAAADVDFPGVKHLMDGVWSSEWLEREHNESDRYTVFKPDLVKHIKGVQIFPQPNGGRDARLIAPNLRGLMMGAPLYKSEVGK